MKIKFISLMIFVFTISFLGNLQYLDAFLCTATPGYELVNGVCLPKAKAVGVSGDDEIIKVIVKAISFILKFLGGLATLMILVSGVMYITSESDESRVDMAKRIFTTAIYGLVLALLAYVIVYAVSKALGAI